MSNRQSGRGWGLILPGLPQIWAGRRGTGVLVLASWLALVGLAIHQRARVVAGLTGRIDEQIAVLTLGVVLVGLSWWSLRTGGTEAPERLDSGGLTPWTSLARVVGRDRLAVAGAVVLAALYVLALLTPLFAPYDPGHQGDLLTERLVGPSAAHLLGTDRFARDVLTRLLYGARVSLSIGFVAVAIAVSIGTVLGALSGYLGGWFDRVAMRTVDVVLAFPRLVLLIVVIAILQEPSMFMIVAVLGLTQWPHTARIVRAEALSLRERDFIDAAKALGFSRGRVVLRHVIPNTLGPVIVTATLGIGQTILLEAGLSFLGIGIQPPTPSWGSMVAEGRNNLIDAWWVSTFPGLAIVLTVLAFNVLGDGLRDGLDPRANRLA